MRHPAVLALHSPCTVQALCEGLRDASPLFRHEVAYVLGQLQV